MRGLVTLFLIFAWSAVFTVLFLVVLFIAAGLYTAIGKWSLVVLGLLAVLALAATVQAGRHKEEL